MITKIRGFWPDLQHRLALSPAWSRKVLPLGLGLAILLVLLLMLRSQWGSEHRPLFGARENIAVADVVAALEAENLPYRLHPDSGQVLVAERDLARARMLLAAKGVVAKLPQGLELMDRNDPLGVSQFVQDVRFRRGLEGELARSIATLDAVQSARVHLSIARSSSFVVNTGDKSTASVILQMKPGQQLRREQIAAIIHMVSSSVAGLKAQDVSLTDQAGNFLSARVDLSEGYDASSQDDPSARLTQELRHNAQELLTAAVGTGHYRVTVTADLSQDRTDETYEKYSGDPRVLSEATREENERSAGAALGIPGSLSNRPVTTAADQPGAAGAAGGKDANGNSRSALSRNFAYDRSLVQVKRSKGSVKKLSVAVVLDDAVAPQDAQAWGEDELKRIESLLRAGLGVNAERGDLLAVSSMRFVSAAPAVPWWQEPGFWMDAARVALLVIVAGVLLRWLQRLMRLVLKSPQAEALGRSPALIGAGTGQPLLAGEGAERAALGALGAAETGLLAQGDRATGMAPLLENVDLPPPGSQVDVMVEHLRTLSAREPERVAEVVKQWVQKHGQPAAVE